MIVRHSAEQIKDYFERIGINQSSLKVLINDGIQIFSAQREQLVSQDDLYYEEKKHFIVGSAVDCRLTQGEEVFLNTYHFSKLVKKPGDKAMSVIKLAFDRARQEFPLGVDIDITGYKKHIFDAANDQEYYLNRRNKDGDHELDTRIASLIKDNGREYWADLSLAEDKQVLSDEEQNIINAIIISLTTHKHTAQLFKDGDYIDIIYQMPLYFSYGEVDCKGMIDMIIVNHTRKKLFPIDIKTLGDFTLRFNRAIKKRRYDLQGSFYTYGLSQCLTQIGELINKNLSKYEIANFAFVVESTIKPGCPMVFVLSDEILEEGRVGSIEEGFLGWTQGIEIYKAWSDIDFSVEKKFEETNGVMFITKATINSTTL